MSRPIIEITNVSKRYKLGQFNARTLREEAEHLIRRLRKKGVSGAAADATEFWALSDVSFSVQPGEVLGIIGRNGAGKSTLLKILSRVTEPTNGEIRIRGRVASLLEVGTGFHPELTGRENIFLNGAIMGMTWAEIKTKLDEIVAFAEVERFVDTPVKRYSSGMYVRLAFAVAAHLEPEILIVDEVLAVGDAEFQNKCLGKMEDISHREGRTVLFVSHNHHVMERLCERCVLLADGRIRRIGATSAVLNEYLCSSNSSGLIAFQNPVRAMRAAAELRMLSFAFDASTSPTIRRPFLATVRLEVSQPVRELVFGIGFNAVDGHRVLTCDSDYGGGSGEFTSLGPGEYDLDMIIPALPLWPARYVLDIGCRTRAGRMLDEVHGFAIIDVAADETTPRIGIGTFPTACAPSSWRLSVDARVVA